MNRRPRSLLDLLSFAVLTLLITGVTACGQAGDDGPVPSSTSQGAHVDDGACPLIPDTVNIDQQSDLAQFADMSCFRIERHLFVQETDDITDLSALSGLRSTGGFVGIADNVALTDASLPNLEETGEGLVVEGNQALESISFDNLRHVAGYLHVFNNQALTSASFKWLFGVGDDVIFAGNDALTDLDLSHLTCVMGRFIFEHSDALGCLCLPNLVVVNGDFKVYFNGGLRSISAPVLTTVWGDIDIRRNPLLEHLDLSCLEHVIGDISILHNRLLAQCEVDDLIAGIDMIGGDAIVGNNAQTCPEEPTTAEDVDCAPCTTNICVPGDRPTPPPPGDDDDDDDDDDDVGVDVGPKPDVGDDDDDDAGMDAGKDVGDDDDDDAGKDVGDDDDDDAGMDAGKDIGDDDDDDAGMDAGKDIGDDDDDVGGIDVGDDDDDDVVPGRMTGGGRIDDGGTRVTHGFTLHCDANEGPNNLQINWGRGNRFHLEELTSAICTDDPEIDEGNPEAGFDTYQGEGTGRYNNQSGATATWTLTDAGEPGGSDVFMITIEFGGEVVLDASATILRGNHQAHPERP